MRLFRPFLALLALGVLTAIAACDWLKDGPIEPGTFQAVISTEPAIHLRGTASFVPGDSVYRFSEGAWRRVPTTIITLVDPTAEGPDTLQIKVTDAVRGGSFSDFAGGFPFGIRMTYGDLVSGARTLSFSDVSEQVLVGTLQSNMRDATPFSGPPMEGTYRTAVDFHALRVPAPE